MCFLKVNASFLIRYFPKRCWLPSLSLFFFSLINIIFFIVFIFFHRAWLLMTFLDLERCRRDLFPWARMDLSNLLCFCFFSEPKQPRRPWPLFRSRPRPLREKGISGRKFFVFFFQSNPEGLGQELLGWPAFVLFFLILTKKKKKSHALPNSICIDLRVVKKEKKNIVKKKLHKS